MTYEVQQTRYDRIIRRVTGSIGPGSRVSESISELFPMVDVENVPGELLLLGGTQICMGATIEVPAVARFPLSMVRNPGGSNALITVTQVVMHSPTSMEVNAGPTLNTFPNAGQQTIRDTRRGPAGQPVGQALSDSSLVIGPLFHRLAVTAGEALIWSDDNGLAVLAPGTAFAVGGLVTNTELAVGWLWRERPAEQSELTL